MPNRSNIRYFKISNTDGKIWVMPNQNMKTAMLLYQPSGWKGKLLKKYFPLLHHFSFIRKILHITVCEPPISRKQNQYFKQIFKENKLEYSWFSGTPNKHQKITVQIFKEKHIIGYCKFTESKEIYDLFKREHTFLMWMEEKGVKHVPRCLYCGKADNGLYMFVQSTEKTLNSYVNHNLGNYEISFLKSLINKTLQRKHFIDSDQYKSIKRLKLHLDTFDKRAKNSLTTLIKISENYYSSNKEYQFAAYHSDFTPWNMFIENELFVFDFEYAGYSYMPFLDIFHFLFQTAMFEKEWDAYKIYNHLLMNKETYSAYFDDYTVALSLYLIDIIGLYAEREHGNLDNQQKIRLQIAEMIANSKKGL